MLKYIYVLILIIILFGIKWKLQKKYELKEEFWTPPADKLADMFSSVALSFYDKLNIINSNINVNNNKHITFSINEFVRFTDINVPNSNDIEFKIQDARVPSYPSTSLHIKDINFDVYISNNSNMNIMKVNSTNQTTVTTFNRTLNMTEAINTSMSNLDQWHALMYEGYSGEPFHNTLLNYSTLWNKTISECHSSCESDARCIGFSIENNRTPGNCYLEQTSTTLDTTNTNYTTYFKPSTSLS